MPGQSAFDARSIQGTMLLPLWGRAEVSCLYPDFLCDAEARRIIKGMRHDFSEVARSFGEYGMLNFAMRARKFDEAVKAYLDAHPEATVVNIGAGLDTTFSRVDNGRMRWYDLDLPDAIAFRKTLIPETERGRCIAKSMFDDSWFDDVAFDPQKRILFLSGGVFYYFNETEIHGVTRKLAERFPGGELIFDAASPMGKKIANRMVKNAGNQGAQMRFSVKRSSDLKNWSDKIAQVQAESYHGGIPMNPAWKLATRLGIRLGAWLRMLWIVRMQFKTEES